MPEAEIARFCRRNKILSLALFGSVLRDDFGPRSDVDILVDFEPGATVGMLALSRMRREFSALLARPVDLVLRNGLKPRIRDRVVASSEEPYTR